ncbi:MAG: M13 family metallopeptidase [Dysgonamonadaceae bacterium]|jgi:putative endopeptidase|nr:M13 family metallopeptidase [Dysgonamonadaceae bacterium]
MKKNFIYLTVVFTMILSACSENKQQVVKGIDPANMDTTAIAGNDFYQYATGGWQVMHPLKPEHARFGAFDELREKSHEQVRGLVEELGKKMNKQGSLGQKIGDLYASALDSARLNSEGATPILPYLKKLNAIADKTEITNTLAQMFRDGTSPFFGHFVYADDKNSSINILHINQGGYRMGDRDYYLLDDETSLNIRTKYVELIEKLFALAGYNPEEIQKASDAIMKIETQLAQIAFPREALRDPMANYHKISLDELITLSPAIEWKALFNTIGLKDINELNVGQLQPIAEVSKIIQEYPIEDIKYYLCWNVISNASSFLSDDFSDASFEFYGKTLSGKEEQRERWKRAIDIVDACLGEAVGQIYVEKYFPPSSKEKMLDLVKNLQIALGERINMLEWMSGETKQKAQEKLSTFHVKIGYPDKWRDYSGLTINKENSYWDNIISSNNFDYDYMISKFNQPVDKNEWLMTPQTVNAYYNPVTNEICFPAAILQPPFFNINADDAVNYGAIGVVIGHEMTHGFDDQGRQFDKNGNLTDWWTPEDAEQFKERAQVLVDYFDNIVVLDTVHANGRYTLGENIADQGGLQVSWQAYQNTLKAKNAPDPIDGYTDAQRFFLAYATVWAGNIRDAEILRLTKMDTHALGKWRVNGALPQIDAWYDAFNVKPENTLYLSKEKRVAIW